MARKYSRKVYDLVHSLGGDAAAALNDSLILGLLTVRAGVVPLVGDIGPETGGLVARGEGTTGAELENEVTLRRGEGATKPFDRRLGVGPVGGGDVADAAGIEPGTPPPGGLNSR